MSDQIISRITKGAAVSSGSINSAMTCLLWHGGHLWSVSVLQRVHFPYLCFQDNKISTLNLSFHGYSLSPVLLP
jgi:hypothetical protein